MKLKNISIRLNNDNRLIIYTNISNFMSEENSEYIFKQIRYNRKYIRRINNNRRKSINKVSRFESWSKQSLSNIYQINKCLHITLIKNTEIILLATLNKSYDIYKEINVELEFYNQYKINLIDIINILRMEGKKEKCLEFKEKEPYPTVTVKFSNIENTFIMHIEKQGDN